MYIDPTTKRHGKAAAAALLHELEHLTRAGREESKIGKDFQTVGVRLFGSYMEAFAFASPLAQAGFAEVMGHFVSNSTAKLPPYAIAYERSYFHGGKDGPTAQQRDAHARIWLARANATAQAVLNVHTTASAAARAPSAKSNLRRPRIAPPDASQRAQA
jgi:hypothetical protein